MKYFNIKINLIFLYFIPLQVKAQNAFLDVPKFLTAKSEYQETLAKIESGELKNRITSREQAILQNINLFFKNPFSDSVDARLLQINDFQKIVKFRESQNFKNNAITEAANTIVVDANSNFQLFNQPFDRSMMPAKMADAAAQFLVKRTREEMLGMFFERFKSEIDKYELLKYLLPATHRLMAFQPSSAQTPSLGKSWTTVFESDLKNSMFNFEWFLRERNPQILRQGEGQLFSMNLQTIRLLGERHAAPEILGFLEEKYAKESPENAEIWKSIKLTNCLSRNLLIDIKKADVWAHRDSFQNLGTEGGAIFWGLIYQRNRALFKRLNIILTNENVGFFLTMTDEFLHHAEQLKKPSDQNNNSYTVSNAEETAQKRLDAQLNNAQILLQLLETGFKAKFYLENAPEKYYHSDIFLKKMAIPRNALSVFRLMKNRQYGLALLGTAEILEMLLPTESKEGGNRALKRFIFYANFMTDIITADNANLGQIVDRYAVPVGSYRTKRIAPFSIDINAYPGFFIGYETVRGNLRTPSNGGVHGVAAPIGLSVSKSLGKNGEAGHSISLFFPVVDIGAAFSFRWSNGNGGGLPEKFKLSQIFSPGAYLVWGVKGAPMSVMVGGQYSPQLRQIADFRNVITDSDAIRIGLTISMDIPIFNLYH